MTARGPFDCIPIFSGCRGMGCGIVETCCHRLRAEVVIHDRSEEGPGYDSRQTQSPLFCVLSLRNSVSAPLTLLRWRSSAFQTGSLAVLLEIGTTSPETTQVECLVGAGPGLLSAEFRPVYNGG